MARSYLGANYPEDLDVVFEVLVTPVDIQSNLILHVHELYMCEVWFFIHM